MEALPTDTKVKPLDYADARIPHMWLNDSNAPVTEELQRAEGSSPSPRRSR